MNIYRWILDYIVKHGLILYVSISVSGEASVNHNLLKDWFWGQNVYFLPQAYSTLFSTVPLSHSLSVILL